MIFFFLLLLSLTNNIQHKSYYKHKVHFLYNNQEIDTNNKVSPVQYTESLGPLISYVIWFQCIKNRPKSFGQEFMLQSTNWSATTYNRACWENLDVFTINSNESHSWRSTRWCMGFVSRCFMPRIKSKWCIRSHWIRGCIIQGVTILSQNCVRWMRRRIETTPMFLSILSQWTWRGRYR